MTQLRPIARGKKRYTVQGVFQYDIVIEKPRGGVSERRRHYEERLALVEARGEVAARARAARFFRESEVEDDREFLQRIAIRFLGIADIVELDMLLEHGPGVDEVYWRLVDKKPRIRWPRARTGLPKRTSRAKASRGS